jgi:BirA family biotin operon repressor/biotin-[acetyl-CoA-carboxylase] ligase
MFDGVTDAELGVIAGAPLVRAFAEVGSTMDVAHEMADGGAPSGTLVLADVQTAGRGRLGRSWTSSAGHGLWLTAVQRDVDRAALECLTIRIGLALAHVLDAFAAAPVQLKWPNDLFVEGRKLAGILTEARWREDALAWVAVGVGINLAPPRDRPDATGLGSGVVRADVLRVVAPAIRLACSATGRLSSDEMDAFGRRDWLRGRRLAAPVPGFAAGIDESGALMVQCGADRRFVNSGSVTVEA